MRQGHYRATSDQLLKSEMLETAREQLRGSGATRANIIGAMDGLHEAVSGMNVMFAIGKMNGPMDEEWELDRSTGAYALPALTQGLGQFWMQLREHDPIK